MQAATLSILACPTCRGGYSHHAIDDEAGLGHLSCRACGVFIPVIEGFPLFTQARMHEGQVSGDALLALGRALFGEAGAYESYRRRKHDRDLWEAYAAFQPFNESTRAAEPLLPILAAHLAPDDVILDVWGRTGWSGEWLAGLFPNHRVISLWEGDSSVLGYRGFRHWLGQARRAPNLDILFTPPNRPLPFRDDTFGVVYALDCLHRYDVYPFAGECLRVARPDGAILFAHLHLSNSEPDPFFERGGRHLHGGDYRAWLDTILAGDRRRGWVLSEADLFEAQPGDRLRDDPSMAHYNGAVLIADPARAVMQAGNRAAPDPEARWLLNPLLSLRPGCSDLQVDGALRDGEVARLLARHPIYHRRLPRQPLALSGEDWLILCLAVTGLTLAEMAEVLGPALDARLARLVRAEALLPAAISKPAHDLQRFHANQLAPTDAGQRLVRLLEAWETQDAPAVRLPDGAALTGRDMARTVAAAMAVLAQAGLRAGDSLHLRPVDGPLALILLLAGLAARLEVQLGESLPDRGQSPGLTVVAAGAPLPPGPTAAMRLSGDGLGFAECLSAILDSDPPSAPRQAGDDQSGGGLTLAIGGRPYRLDAERLLDAAGAFHHAIRPERSWNGVFGEIPGILSVLTVLLRGNEIVFPA